MDVAIFGAGVGGLMTALMLEKRGHKCRIYERAVRHPDVGMGVILTREATHLLQSFGIELPGTPLDHYHQYDHEGELTFTDNMPGGALGIRRRDLMQAMAAMLSPSTTCTYGAGLEGMEFDASANVTAAMLTSGESVKADLYVAADGMRSSARRHLYPDWPLPAARVMEIVALVEFGDLYRWAGNRLTKYYAAQGGAAFGIVPANEKCVVWYCQFDSERFPAPGLGADACRKFMQTLVGEWCNPIPALLQATDFSRAHLWRPIDAELVPRFYQGNLVLVGDAAHSVLPFTSYGTAGAIADAVALAQALDAFDDVSQALAQYCAVRRADRSPYVNLGRAMTKAFLEPIGSSWAVPIADAASAGGRQ